MSFAVLTVLLTLVAACGLLGFGTPAQGSTANLIFTLLIFGGTVAAVNAPGVSLLHADPAGLTFGILAGFISLTTAITNRTFVRQHTEAMNPRRWRIYHALCQLLLGAVLLGLYADNFLLVWLGAELALIAGTIALSLIPRLTPDPAAPVAARRCLVAGTAALAFGALGTMLLYAAVQSGSLVSLGALGFAALTTRTLSAPLLPLAFVFLLGGYGAIAAIFPFHAWRGEIATPLTTSLAALIPNLMLLTILRFSHLVHGQVASAYLLAAGMAGLIVALARLIMAENLIASFSSFGIGTSALAVFAFGIGSPAAIFGALLIMLLAPLISSAAFQTILAGGDTRHPGLVAAALFAAAAVPPSGLFSGAFIICGQTIQYRPLLAAPLILLMLFTGIVLLRRLPSVRSARFGRVAVTPALHLILMLVIAFAMPLALVHLLSAAATGAQ